MILPMTAGAYQDSMLGPLLWNVVYDDDLELRDPSSSVKFLVYLGNLAVTA